jgi:hypothetical protein
MRLIKALVIVLKLNKALSSFTSYSLAKWKKLSLRANFFAKLGKN